MRRRLERHVFLRLVDAREHDGAQRVVGRRRPIPARSLHAHALALHAHLRLMKLAIVGRRRVKRQQVIPGRIVDRLQQACVGDDRFSARLVGKTPQRIERLPC